MHVTYRQIMERLQELPDSFLDQTATVGTDKGFFAVRTFGHAIDSTEDMSADQLVLDIEPPL